MRAAILACLLFLAPICGAMADSSVGVPLAKPAQAEAPKAEPVAECPEGLVSVSKIWPVVEETIEGGASGHAAMILGGASAGQMIGALSRLTGKTAPSITTIVMFGFPDGSQLWVPMAGGCATGIIVLPKEMIARLYEALGQSI